MNSYSLVEKFALIKEAILSSAEKDPIAIVRSVMDKDFVSMHGPEHHFLDGAALLASLSSAGLKMDLEKNLDALAERAYKMPGAMCGYWGVCGSVASIGAALAILDGTLPLSKDESYSSHMELTSKIIAKMARIGGPRCCKRNAFLSLTAAIEYANERYGTDLTVGKIECDYSLRNAQCIGTSCPFHKAK